VTRKHGVTHEDVREDAEKDEANYQKAKEGGWCCLLELGLAASVIAGLLAIPSFLL
jgi:hypothetical protein